jgi:hypothetical protein
VVERDPLRRLRRDAVGRRFGEAVDDDVGALGDLLVDGFVRDDVEASGGVDVQAEALDGPCPLADVGLGVEDLI